MATKNLDPLQIIAKHSMEIIRLMSEEPEWYDRYIKKFAISEDDMRTNTLAEIDAYLALLRSLLILRSSTSEPFVPDQG